MSGPRLCFLLLDHKGDEYFRDLVTTIRVFCPAADIVWFDAGEVGATEYTADIPRLAASRPLVYAKETPFFFDAFEWAAGRGYDYLVNVETDMAFVNSDFESFVASTMPTCDYLAPRLELKTPNTSKWRPYRSLRGELPELLDILGIGHTHRAFNPGQVFSMRFVESVLNAPFYDRLRRFVERNQAPEHSFSLVEVLMPTLAEALGLPFTGYPDEFAAYNRYRPYHAERSVWRAAAEGVPFVHPVRRDPDHPARRFVRSLISSDDSK
ncbi:hypothetical protein L0U85_07975 [Glycomyces sp. L485]|uniref:hypothetical protein n=1 Tax=Glycomyces sp. L485 TaxID=2909235 RepID=UPI001F4AFF73|nr:hypothetical protein [Glycomyces sp. L485]MCH7230787.1 hypothetical protein [Glycomyces sp. L485]